MCGMKFMFFNNIFALEIFDVDLIGSDGIAHNEL
jgi:hypothetical protein